MNLRAIDLNLLTVFDAVITEGNMTRAAKKIGMSQPALSLAMARFRHIAKDELFESTGRGVKPTPRALQLAVPVRRALDLVSGALENSTDFDITQSERTFNLVLADYGERVLLPRLMEVLDEIDSPIRIKTLSAAGLDIAKEMHFGNIDLYAWIEPIDDKDFSCQQMGTLREVCLVRKDHPQIKDKVSMEQYASLRHIVLDISGDHGASSVDRELWSHGLKREHRMTVHTYFDVPSVLSATDMISTMPLQLARRFAEAYPLKIVPSPVARDLPMFLIWHNSMDKDPGHRWLREYLIDLNSRV
jgi:DNA-binding transcriptional LysR family regulator